jgi:hypothetical protein
MSCYTSCATSQDYKNGWEFYGPDWEGSVASHQFEVGRDPILLIADGLLPGQCIRIEWVSGCGAGDTFLPYVQGCCPATICPPQNRLLIAESGRYRMVLSGATVPDPTNVSVYGRPQLVPPGYGDGAMSCCNEPVVTHVPATITSLDGVTAVGVSGTDNQAFTLDFNPVIATAEVVASPVAVGMLCAALTPCMEALIPAPITVSTTDPYLTVTSTLTGYLIDFNENLLPPVPVTHVPATITSLDGVTVVGVSGTDNQTFTLDFNPVAGATELTTNVTSLGILCTALTPCMEALIPPPLPPGTVFQNFTSPTSTVIIGGSGTANVTLDVDPVSTSGVLISNLTAFNTLCTGLKACITAGLQPQLNDCTGAPLASGAQVALCSDIPAITPVAITPLDALSGLLMQVTEPLPQQFKYAIKITTLPDLLTNGVGTNQLVTDDLFRAALGTGQDRFISISRADTAGQFINTGATTSSAVTAVRSGAGTGNALAGTKLTGAYGGGVYGEEAGSGGYGVIGYASSAGALGAGYFLKPAGNGSSAPALLVQNDSPNGNGQTTYANATAGYFESANNIGMHATGGNGSVGAGFFQNIGNGIYATMCTVGVGLLTNGDVSANAFIVTSDSRLKSNVKDIDVDAALKLQAGVRWVEYSKALMEAPDVPERDDKSRVGAKPATPTSRQSGVIAQELQKLTAEIGAFEYLVQSMDPNDPKAYLTVDYGSLNAILAVAERERANRLEARLAKAGF